MRLISDFAGKFNASMSLDQDLIVKKRSRYFLLNRNLRQLITEDFFYAGLYLGKVKNKMFFPSFNFLAMMMQAEANKTTVDRKTEWLFICGRDIFKKGITGTSKSGKKGDYTLVLNRHGECLGFGKILHDIDASGKNKVVVRNIADVGDFLRREK